MRLGGARYPDSMRRVGFLGWTLLALAAVSPAPVSAAEGAEPATGLPAETVEARAHFFGRGNVDAEGRVRSGRVIVSWFSVGSLAAAIDGHVVLLDTYIHKGEDRPNYVPTTTRELIALRPEAIFVGHGHFDHAATAGTIAARTGAVLVGTPQHCEQAREEASGEAGGPAAVECIEAAGADSAPGSEVRQIRPLGEDVAVSVVKHLHSAAEPPDGEGHETTLQTAPLPDSGLILLHPPGPSVLAGLDPSGDEGGTLLYRFQVGDFSFVWHDSAGPLREQGPQLFDVLRSLRPADVQIGAVLGFNEPTNGLRDPVDYLVSLAPKVFFPIHQDFVAEYGASKSMEGVMRREIARRGGVPSEVRWLYDPYDYVRPELMSFDVADPRWSDGPTAAAEDRPALRLGRRCARGGRLRIRVTGRRGDLRAVRDVSFKLDRRLVRRDTRAPFTWTLGRRRLERTSAKRLRAVVRLDGTGRPRAILSRRLRRCGG